MNRFILSTNIHESVSMYCDQHLRKMPTEEGQILGTNLRILCKLFDYPEEEYKTLPSEFNPNHPTTKWSRESLYGMTTSLQYFDELLTCYHARFGTKHNYYMLLPRVSRLVLEISKLYNFPIPDSYAMDNIPAARNEFETTYQNLPSTVERFRLIYIQDKSSFATWQGKQPEWYTNGLAAYKDKQAAFRSRIYRRA